MITLHVIHRKTQPQIDKFFCEIKSTEAVNPAYQRSLSNTDGGMNNSVWLSLVVSPLRICPFGRKGEVYNCFNQYSRTNAFLNTLGGWGRSLSQAAYYTKYKRSNPNLCFTYISHSISCRPNALKTKTIYSILRCYFGELVRVKTGTICFQ